MKEREAREFLAQAGNYGIVPGLETMGELCRRLGNPQEKLQFVHIAGTNGKGSVSAYIATVLQEAGYRVGRYFSPAVFQYREIIQVNGRCIPVKALCRGLEQIQEICGQMTGEGHAHPTAFEIETALGFLYFREKQCDIVVLETGMGGLLDATNIVENTVLAVLTSISMDHMKFLGKTLGEIAAQKAGILKATRPVVCGEQQEEAMEVIQAEAARLACPLVLAGRGMVSHVQYGLKRQHFDYGILRGLEITLAGSCQIENAALAVGTILELGKQGYVIPEEALRKGLCETVWRGRFTILGERPYFVADGAHNADAAKRLAESITFYFTNKRIVYIIGVLRDKAYEEILSATHFLADQIITVTPPGNTRALSAYELAGEVARIHPRVTAADSLEEAVEMAYLLTGKEDVIVAFGSLSYLGRLSEIVSQRGERSKGSGAGKN